MIKISRDRLIQLVLDYKEVFYTLIDYLDSKSTNNEIPQYLYIQEYNRIIVTSENEKAIRTLSLESLHKNGIIAHLDNQTGTLTLQSFVIEMIRFIDKKRIRELSQVDFELIRKTMQDLCEKFDNRLTISPTHSDYDEARITLFETIDNTLSRIQQNIEALTANTDDLGARYDDIDKQGFNSTDSMKLLDDAGNLYERFIQPCLEFLSPSIGMKQGQNTFTHSMERLSELHVNRGEPEIGERLRYKLTAIRSFYKDISEIEKRVKRYYRSLSEERLRYNAIEKAYNKLLESVTELRHGKLRGIRLPGNAEVFQDSTVFTGLKRQLNNQEGRLNWYDDNNALRLDEWITSALDKEVVTEDVTLIAVENTTDITEERYHMIMKLCMAKKWPPSDEDFVAYCHRWLSNELEDYHLRDLLVAYQYAHSLQKMMKRLNFKLKKKSIIFNNTFFTYLDCELREEDKLENAA
ncbi:Uncharacterised protein [BD1-7 clade bacterium]|nr:Uncharacterised protein [BD1-7 clade bacterium]